MLVCLVFLAFLALRLGFCCSLTGHFPFWTVSVLRLWRCITLGGRPFFFAAYKLQQQRRSVGTWVGSVGLQDFGTFYATDPIVSW